MKIKKETKDRYFAFRTTQEVLNKLTRLEEETGASKTKVIERLIEKERLKKKV